MPNPFEKWMRRIIREEIEAHDRRRAIEASKRATRRLTETMREVAMAGRPRPLPPRPRRRFPLDHEPD